ncbi:hypothetical protein [Flavihumibacter solisilvae]|uniref:Uncharacterized protein n=1 Tax=Flavihumibacter solisilvae TaxID=1349421 RepID=A0A0C1LFI1_9BACT|nr:hypothetical protein [Flavihumibacter solisilvae]KIC94093.1 hypothetical protein OI18_13910 [Flavihumibacter solisilvae]
MAASSKTALFKDYTGKINNQFVLKRYGDKSVICRLPKKNKRKERTPNQLENNMVMKMANNCAKALIKDPARRDAALLKLNVTRNKLYTSLVSLYFQQAKAAKENNKPYPGKLILPGNEVTTNG